MKLKKNCKRLKILLSLRIRCQFGQAHQMHMYAIHTKDQDNMKSANKYWWVCINSTYRVLDSIYCLFILLKNSKFGSMPFQINPWTNCGVSSLFHSHFLFQVVMKNLQNVMAKWALWGKLMSSNRPCLGVRWCFDLYWAWAHV